MEELFRAKVIDLLVEEKLLPPQRVQILYSWKHSGFNLHAGELVPPEAKADLEDLAQCILRNNYSPAQRRVHADAKKQFPISISYQFSKFRENRFI